MRIVHVAPFYYPVVGGVEEVVRRIAEYMASKGHDVYVLTYNRLRVGGELSLPQNDIINGVRVIRVKPDFIWSSGTYSSEVPNVLERLKPDLVHVHAWRHPHVFQVAKIRRKLKFKAVIHTHAPFHKLNQLGLITWLYHKLIDQMAKGILREYDIVVALTPYEKDLLVEKLGVESKKVKVIPNGISDEISNVNINVVEVGLLNEKPAILYVGRISKSKNLDLILKAMKVLTKKKTAKLILAGPDENLIVKLKNYSRKFNIDLNYMGQVSEIDKYMLYSRCVIFAHPAIYEPFGITLLEAQALGKPCIITGDGGQLYVAPPGQTSLYAKPSPDDFGEKMAILLTDEELYKKLSRNARAWAFRHLWSKILPEYDKLYNIICA
jgi:glycosyltransferase involved in cell wall biosynthesis